jgi:hypothetical protein
LEIRLFEVPVRRESGLQAGFNHRKSVRGDNKMLVKAWLDEMLQNRNCPRPDGRHLYSYRLDLAEYVSLKACLIEAVAAGSVAVVAHRNYEFCALFVLYASEWWRREYIGGAWKWGPILGSIGVQAGSLVANERTDAILRGFAYWGLRPAREGKRYFGSVVVQGGLPLNAIGKGGGAKLGDVMGAVLRQASRYDWNVRKMADAVEEHAAALPGCLHQRVIYELVAQMVVTALRLKQEFRLDHTDDPVAALDAKFKQWRNEFPIAVDDASAQTLLVGLVKEANTAAVVSQRATFLVVRTLSVVGDRAYELQSLVEHSSSVAGESLATLAGLGSADALPSHFTVDVSAGERTPLASARLIIGMEQCTVALVSRRCHWTGVDACEEHLLYLRGGDLPSVPIAIPGGDLLSADEPWVFVLRDQKYRLVASGSVRLPHSEVLIAIGAAWDVLSKAEQKVEAFGCLHVGDAMRRLIQVSGEVTIVSGEESWKIRIGQSAGLPEQFVAVGSRVDFRTRPWPVFRGMPRIIGYDESGDRRQLGSRQFKCFRAGSGEPLSPGTEAGLVDLIVEIDGDPVARLRFGLAGKDSRETFVSSVTPLKGQIHFQGWGGADIAIDENPDFASKISREGGELVLALDAHLAPPSQVMARLKWPGSRFELSAMLPFPASGGHAYDESARTIPSGQTLALRALIGKKIRIFDTDPDRPKKYEIRLALSGIRPCASGLFPSWPIAVHNGTAEVRLFDLYQEIMGLMAFSDDLDASVIMTLLAGGKPSLLLRIVRYDVVLDHKMFGLALPGKFVATLASNDMAGIRVAAVSLAAPSAEAVMLEQSDSEGVPTGEWLTMGLATNLSPWLVFPAEGSSVHFRPTVVAGGSDAPVADSVLMPGYGLGAAMRIQERALREQSITEALVTMSSNFSDPSWEFLDQLWMAFQRLPLSSIDVYKAIALRPELAVAVLFGSRLASQDLASFVNRLRCELGLFLELAPVSAWRAAAAQLRKYWVRLVGEEGGSESFRLILKERLRVLSQELTNQTLILETLAFEAGETPGPALVDVHREAGRDPGYFGRVLWEGGDSILMRCLLRTHANDEVWPEPFFGTQQALPALRTAMPIEACQTLAKHERSFLWDRSHDFKVSPAIMPAICALWSASDVPLDWWAEPPRRYALRRLRAFDPVWFDECYQHSLASCMSFGIFSPVCAPPSVTPRPAGPRVFPAKPRTVAMTRKRS